MGIFILLRVQWWCRHDVKQFVKGLNIILVGKNLLHTNSTKKTKHTTVHYLQPANLKLVSSNWSESTHLTWRQYNEEGSKVIGHIEKYYVYNINTAIEITGYNIII